MGDKIEIPVRAISVAWRQGLIGLAWLGSQGHLKAYTRVVCGGQRAYGHGACCETNWGGGKGLNDKHDGLKVCGFRPGRQEHVQEGCGSAVMMLKCRDHGQAGVCARCIVLTTLLVAAVG